MAFTTINKSLLHHANLNFDGTGSSNAKYPILSIGVPSFKKVLTYFNSFVVFPVPGGPSIFLITLSPCYVLSLCG